MNEATKTKVKSFRRKASLGFVMLIVPPIFANGLYVSDSNVQEQPLFIALVFLYIGLGIIILVLFLRMDCPKCGQGYFSQDGLPKSSYGLRCQNCGFNVFLSVEL